jgi:hypothetical protein
VGIGTTTPHGSALLVFTAADKGLLIPRVTIVDVTDGVNPVNGMETGLLVYNSAGALAQGFYYWDGTEWVMLGAGGGASCVTLDEAHDCGGAGVGRTINADAGAVEIITAAVLATHSNNGIAIGAAMPNLYVAEEISNNSFVIGGGDANKKVSWQVTGVRQDKFANENRIVDEVEKEDYNKGRY